MHCGTSSFLIFWAIFTGLCGAWVTPLQDPFDDRATAASRSVHEALVKAAIIPDGEYILNGHVAEALAFRIVNIYIGLKSRQRRLPSLPVEVKDNAYSQLVADTLPLQFSMIFNHQSTSRFPTQRHTRW